MAGWRQTHWSTGRLHKSMSLYSLLGIVILFVVADQAFNLYHFFYLIFLRSLVSFLLRFVETVSKTFIPDLHS